MLPRKRPEVFVEDDDTSETQSFIKKHRIGSLTSATAATANDGDDSGDVKSNAGFIGNINSSNHSSGGGTVLPEMVLGDGNPPDIDEDLHSRQLAVYGRETMRRLFASNILVSGMQGLGAEIVKNLVLAGVKSVTSHDEGAVELWDLSSNFIFSENDVGKNRALASVQKLQELNNAVVISTLTTKLTKEQLSNFQAVVFTDVNQEQAIEFNDYCHNHGPPIAFIKAEVRGLFGSVFCDFGPEFTVFDVDGEEPHTGIIASISNDSPALVSCVDDERLEFQDGDLVVFSEIRGMTELNDGKPRKIKSARPYSFILEEDTTNFGSYEEGGIVTQVKQPKVLNFKPLREALKDPGDFLLSDFSKFDRPPLLHLAFQALDKFISELGCFPVAGSEEDAQKLISIVSDINEGSGDGKLNDVNPKLLQYFAFGARAVLNYEAWTRQNGSRGGVGYGDTPGTRGHAGDTYGTRHLACPLNLIYFFGMGHVGDTAGHGKRTRQGNKMKTLIRRKRRRRAKSKIRIRKERRNANLVISISIDRSIDLSRSPSPVDLGLQLIFHHLRLYSLSSLARLSLASSLASRLSSLVSRLSPFAFRLSPFVCLSSASLLLSPLSSTPLALSLRQNASLTNPVRR